MKQKVFKLPNALIRNEDNLAPSAIGVAQVLYANMNRQGRFTASIQRIAARSHRCPDTVRQALAQLEQAGYIRKIRNWKYSQEHGHCVFAATTYQILRMPDRDFTLVPYRWLRSDLTACAVQVLLVCRMHMRKEPNRAYPSIRRMAAVAGLAKATICRALNQIVCLGLLVKEFCKKATGTFSCNSYFLCLPTQLERTVRLTSDPVYIIADATLFDKWGRWSQK